MTLRETTEAREVQFLSPFAQRSAATQGRAAPEIPCDIRTEFQRDRDRITHCKAFRRLMHKTQVFIAPEGDHFRTRLTHTLEVAQIARTIARGLALNEDLTEAIALGHDLGHTPFGHTGEDALNRLLPGGFRHNEQSLRVAVRLENGGQGLNLTAEVLDGMLNHRTACAPATLEGQAVQISDKVAYINHDIDDALRAGCVREGDLPRRWVDLLGLTGRERIDRLVREILRHSQGRPALGMDPAVLEAMNGLKNFLWEQVYGKQQARERKKIGRMLAELFEYFCQNPREIPPEFLAMAQGESVQRAVCDYIACMTDRFALRVYEQVFVPSAWK
jgi:dGTPase